MALATRLEKFLRFNDICFVELPLPAAASLEAAVSASGESPDNVIRATPLIDINGVVVAVHRLNSALDLDAVNELAGRRLQPLVARQADRLFADCKAGFHPPAGAAYELEVWVDDDVLSMSRAVMTGGSDDSLLLMDGAGLRKILAGAHHGRLMIRGQGDTGARRLTLEEVAEQLQSLYRLPPMPAVAIRILELTADAEATARELAELVEFDPSLTAQIMRYARSALFNYQGQVTSVQEAITRVLGFDRVAHMALGIASVRAFEVPRQGMLGMDQFWRHSLYCAFLCQRIGSMTGSDKGLSYLCGMLHNFGLLLVGHLFPEAFAELNSLREDNPEVSMRSLELQVFGSDAGQDMLSVGHGAIGGILHRLWQLPDAVVKSAGVHQVHDYHGEHETYVLMVQLANGLLKERGIGDELSPDPVSDFSGRLGLTADQVDGLRQEVDRVADHLDELAGALTY